MSIVALEGIVENGQIRLEPKVRLPEHTKVYVVVPEIEVKHSARVFSPRLAHPQQSADFKMEVIVKKNEPHSKENIVKLGGLLKGFEPADEEIQQARKEMWQHLERKEIDTVW
jgi:hypothetical protein